MSLQAEYGFVDVEIIRKIVDEVNIINNKTNLELTTIDFTSATTSGSNIIYIPNNQVDALSIREDVNSFLTFDTLNNKIITGNVNFDFGGNLSTENIIVGNSEIEFTNAVPDTNNIIIPNNVNKAFTIKESGTNFVQIDTVADEIIINQDVTFEKDVVINQDLTILGTFIQTTSLTVTDCTVQLCDGNAADLLNTGIFSTYNTNNFSGFIRDPGVKRWKLFKDITINPEILSTAQLDAALAELDVNELIATTSITTGQLNVDDMRFDGNTFSTQSGNLDIILSPNGSGVVTTANVSKITNTTPATSTTIGSFVVTGGIAVGNNIITGGTVKVDEITFDGTSGSVGISVVDEDINIDTGNVLNFINIPGTSGGLKVHDLQFNSATVSSSMTNQDITLAPDGLGNVVTSAQVEITNATATTDSTSGALIVTGGIASGDNIVAAGTLTSGSSIVIDGTSTGTHTISTTGTEDLYLDTNGANFVKLGSTTGGFQANNLQMSGNTISVLDTNGNLVLTPNGVGLTTTTKRFRIFDTTDTTNSSTGALIISGGVGIAKDIIADGGITCNQLTIDTLDFNSNTISSTNLNGNINLTPNGTGTVVIGTDLDINNINIDGNTISSTDTNGDIILTPDGTGIVDVQRPIKLAGLRGAVGEFSSSSFTVSPTDFLIKLTHNNNQTVNLPNINAANSGQLYVFIKTIAGGTASITPDASDTIDYSVSPIALSSIGDKVKLLSDGVSNWIGV